MAKATGQDVKALLLQARKVPNEPGSVHDVKPSEFLSKSVRSIWKYPDGLVFRLEVDDPNRVKVVTDRSGNALYFSRSKIPHSGTCFLHLGLYVYRVGFLKMFTKLEQAPLEIAERLEQLRALEHGYRIRVVKVESVSWGIDTPEDLERFALSLNQEN